MKGKLVVLAALAGALVALSAPAQDAKDREAALEANGGSAETEAAVTSGLRWLARHQSNDGHWGPSGFTDKCDGKKCGGAGLDDFKVGVTSLATLAFLQAGHLPDSKETYTDPVTEKEVVIGRVVEKALEWLVNQQHDDGSVGPQVGEMMYNHALATRVLCEAYLRTQDAATFKKPAQKAVDFIVTAQNVGLGWRYTPKCGSNDTSVTAMCVLALRSAKLAKLKVPKGCYDGALAWVKRVTDTNGQTGYDRLGSGEIYVPGKNENWAHHPTMSAAGALVRVIVTEKEDDEVNDKAVGTLTGDLPEWDVAEARPKVDFYYWYYGTNAVFEVCGPKSKRWKKWNEALKTALLDNQKLGSWTSDKVKPEGCRGGSWASDKVDRWAYAGGRVYATAINCLTLEVYYAHERVLAKEK